MPAGRLPGSRAAGAAFGPRSPSRRPHRRGRGKAGVKAEAAAPCPALRCGAERDCPLPPAAPASRPPWPTRPPRQCGSRGLRRRAGDRARRPPRLRRAALGRLAKRRGEVALLVRDVHVRPAPFGLFTLKSPAGLPAVAEMLLINRVSASAVLG